MRLRDHTETVRVDLDGDDPYYRVVNPFHPQFHVEPRHAEVEFALGELDRDKALRGIRVTGQRYRAMADGSFKRVGPGRGNPDELTTWYFPAGRAAGLAGDLIKIARAAAYYRKVTGP